MISYPLQQSQKMHTQLEDCRTNLANSPLPAFFVLCIFCVALNFWMGKDLNADMLAYHLYAAHALWTGSYKTDFMGAGLQGFFNPLGYIPFYLLIKAEWHSLAISSAMALLHATNLWLTWLLSKKFLFRGTSHDNWYVWLAVALAGISPVFLAVIGGSFLDPITSIGIIFGIYLLSLWFIRGTQGHRLPLFAGLAMGAMAGLKLTALFPTALAAVCLSAVSLVVGRSLKGLVLFGTGATAGMALTGGFWLLHLWSEFRNPIFPLANNLFQSPDFQHYAIKTDRFLPQSWLDVLAFPFRMMKPNSGTYVEIMAPDIRLAALAVALVVLLCLTLFRVRRAAAIEQDSPLDAPRTFLALFMLTGCAVWIIFLGNGRYQLHLLLLIGPALAYLFSSICGGKRVGVLACAAVAALQIAHGASGGYPRWDSGHWTADWLSIKASDSLARSPARYLVIGPGVISATAISLPKTSHFIELAGLWPFDPSSPEGTRIKRMLDDRALPERVLLRVANARTPDNFADSLPLQEEIAAINELIGPWNRKISGEECSFIRIKIDEEKAPLQTGAEFVLASREHTLLACPVVPGKDYDLELETERLKFQSVQHILEGTCPTLFPKPSTYPIRLGKAWHVRYFGTDIYLTQVEDQWTYSRFPYGPFNIPIPATNEELNPSFHCAKPPQPW